MNRWIAPALLVVAAALPAFADRSVCPRCLLQGESGWSFCPLDGSPLEVRRSPQPATASAAPTSVPPAGAAAARAPESPESMGVSRPSAPPAASPPAVEGLRSSPDRIIDELFSAIAAGERAAIKRLYRWEAFFGEPAGPALDAKVDAYVEQRLIARVRPTLDGKEPRLVPDPLRLTADSAEMKFALRDKKSGALGATYDFKLTKGPDGWKITSVRP